MGVDYLTLYERHGHLVSLTIASLGLSADPEVEDLEQEARLALVKAARDFDPARGAKFSSFAIPRLRGSVLEFRRSRCSWVRRSGQKAKAAVDAALLALELRGEPLTEAAVRALLADPRDYDRAAALPVVVPLMTDEAGYAAGVESLADDTQPLEELVWERQGEAIVERAIRRLRAIDRAVIRGRIQRGMTVREVAERLDVPPAEVTRRERKALAILRRSLNRVSARFVSFAAGFNVRTNPTLRRGRPPVKDPEERLSEKVDYRIDRPRRERALRLAQHLDVSEAEVNRRGIDCLWRQEMGEAAPDAC